MSTDRRYREIAKFRIITAAQSRRDRARDSRFNQRARIFRRRCPPPDAPSIPRLRTCEMPSGVVGAEKRRGRADRLRSSVLIARLYRQHKHAINHFNRAVVFTDTQFYLRKGDTYAATERVLSSHTFAMRARARS